MLAQVTVWQREGSASLDQTVKEAGARIIFPKDPGKILHAVRHI